MHGAFYARTAMELATVRLHVLWEWESVPPYTTQKQNRWYVLLL